MGATGRFGPCNRANAACGKSLKLPTPIVGEPGCRPQAVYRCFSLICSEITWPPLSSMDIGATT
jgi:hypothetical protein